MKLICKMRIRVFFAFVTVASAAYASSAQAAERSHSAQFPKALHGHWLPTDSIDARVKACSLADHADSDRLIEITSLEIKGYEDRTHPTRVMALTKWPRSWQVIAKTDGGDGFVSDPPAIFLLSNNLLTVVSDTHSIRYIRCVK